MKIIDLLNKIANEEEMPEKIRYDRKLYIYLEGSCDYLYYVENNGTMRFLITELFNSSGSVLDILNDEVEIIEEDKKIEKMIKLNNISNSSDMTALCTMQWENNKIMEKKIDEIIDYINKGDK